MRIAFVGKGGSGKTTLAALTAQLLAEQGLPVLLIDADINQNLAEALGRATPLPLSHSLSFLKKTLAGSNAHIPNPTHMIKTTPPGNGSTLLTFAHPFLHVLAPHERGIRLLCAGEVEAADIGVKCYHAKTGAVELLLNHLVDREDEWVIVDMTAGIDAFASGLFTRFDLTVAVVEPTLRSVAVYKEYAERGNEFGIALVAVGNKIKNKDDEAFLQRELGADLLTSFPTSYYVIAHDRGERVPLRVLEPIFRNVFEILLLRARQEKRDLKKYHENTLEFHRRNALSWANAELGTDLTLQIDPDFAYPT